MQIPTIRYSHGVIEWELTVSRGVKQKYTRHYGPVWRVWHRRIGYVSTY